MIFRMILHESLYILLIFYSLFSSGSLGLVYCCIVFMVLNVMCMSVCLKRLASFLIFGLEIWVCLVYVFINFIRRYVFPSSHIHDR